MTEEWGAWIEHDGQGCPCVGMWVESEARDGFVQQHIAHSAGDISLGDAWKWSTLKAEFHGYAVIRYRIRKPRGMTILDGLLESLTDEVDA